MNSYMEMVNNGQLAGAIEACVIIIIGNVLPGSWS